MQHRHPLSAGVLLASLTLGACVGNIGPSGSEAGISGAPAGPGGPGAPGGPNGSGGTAMASGECGAPQVGAERIHRLTTNEYTSSLRTLMANVALEPVLDADRGPIATLDGVRKWYNAADAAVPVSAKWLGAYGGCNPDADAACATTLYEAFAERAFRRP